MKTLIIGSGMAGLTAAAYLVRAGHQVTVYEQFSEIGGVTNVMAGARKAVRKIAGERQ